MNDNIGLNNLIYYMLILINIDLKDKSSLKDTIYYINLIFILFYFCCNLISQIAYFLSEDNIEIPFYS